MSKQRRERAARPMQDLHLTGRRGGRLQVGERRESDPTGSASNADRAYFAAHPAATTYLREAVPGEFGEPSKSALLAGLGLGAIDGVDGEVMVEVTQLVPGYRRRKPAYVLLEAML